MHRDTNNFQHSSFRSPLWNFFYFPCCHSFHFKLNSLTSSNCTLYPLKTILSHQSVEPVFAHKQRSGKAFRIFFCIMLKNWNTHFHLSETSYACFLCDYSKQIKIYLAKSVTKLAFQPFSKVCNQKKNLGNFASLLVCLHQKLFVYFISS